MSPCTRGVKPTVSGQNVDSCHNCVMAVGVGSDLFGLGVVVIQGGDQTVVPR